MTENKGGSASDRTDWMQGVHGFARISANCHTSTHVAQITTNPKAMDKKHTKTSENSIENQ